MFRTGFLSIVRSLVQWYLG